MFLRPVQTPLHIIAGGRSDSAIDFQHHGMRLFSLRRERAHNQQ